MPARGPAYLGPMELRTPIRYALAGLLAAAPVAAAVVAGSPPGRRSSFRH